MKTVVLSQLLDDVASSIYSIFRLFYFFNFYILDWKFFYRFFKIFQNLLIYRLLLFKHKKKQIQNIRLKCPCTEFTKPETDFLHNQVNFVVKKVNLQIIIFLTLSTSSTTHQNQIFGSLRFEFKLFCCIAKFKKKQSHILMKIGKTKIKHGNKSLMTLTMTLF